MSDVETFDEADRIAHEYGPFAAKIKDDMAEEIRAYGDQRARHAAEEMRTALNTALVAMTIASKLPGVDAEYDFGPAIAEVRASLPLPPDLGERK